MAKQRINIEEARKIIGKENEKYSDEEIEEVTSIFRVIADLAIDSYLAKRR